MPPPTAKVFLPRKPRTGAPALPRAAPPYRQTAMAFRGTPTGNEITMPYQVRTPSAFRRRPPNHRRDHVLSKNCWSPLPNPLNSSAPKAMGPNHVHGHSMILFSWADFLGPVFHRCIFVRRLSHKFAGNRKRRARLRTMGEHQSRLLTRCALCTACC